VRYRLQAITQLDAGFDQHPDAFIFKSLPGTGDLLAPGLLVKFGDETLCLMFVFAGQRREHQLHAGHPALGLVREQREAFAR
jgi:hypothetical protein